MPESLFSSLCFYSLLYPLYFRAQLSFCKLISISLCVVLSVSLFTVSVALCQHVGLKHGRYWSRVALQTTFQCTWFRSISCWYLKLELGLNVASPLIKQLLLHVCMAGHANWHAKVFIFFFIPLDFLDSLDFSLYSWKLYYKTPSSGLLYPSSQVTITTFQRLGLSPSLGQSKRFGSKTPGIKPSKG
jgi:hypothetical protein